MSLLLRRIILICLDTFLIISSIWISFILNSNAQVFLENKEKIWIYFIAVIIGIPLYALTGQYKGITRYTGSLSLYKIAIRNIFLLIIVSIFGIITNYSVPEKNIWILIWLLLTFSTGGIRFFLRDLILIYKQLLIKRKKNVLIFGAGDSGIQLASSLKITGGYVIVAFIDENPKLWNRNLNGIQIKPPSELKNLSKDVDQVLLAIPKLNKNKRREIVNNVQKYSLPILQIPSIKELATDKSLKSQLRPVEIEDLLGREPVPPFHSLLGPGIKNQVVCVTGAGGSIGSELCRKIILLQPKKLILIDHSEYNLFKIELDLKNISSNDIKIVAALGSTTQYEFLNQIFKEHKIDTLFHASAYKHVSLVEKNLISGVANNVFSTKNICKASINNNVKKLTLISSDKAVRPTNIMGASKRLSEIICQTFAENINKNEALKSNSCCISIVRFGNVLGSSGSVVPIFKKQIMNGGPITLTHEKVVRYFMTIPEACDLVLQSSVLAKGGEVFLLDMGEPVLIKDLAEQLVSLSGLSIKNKKNPNGDIELKYTGLKPGEKLYEELLIDSKSYTTEHPLIFKANETNNISLKQLDSYLEELEKNIKIRDEQNILKLIKYLVPEWQKN